MLFSQDARWSHNCCLGVLEPQLFERVLYYEPDIIHLEGFLNTLLFTSEGWTFLAIGTCVGALLSAILFSVTVIAMPMLLERDMDFITAMLTSIRAVRESPIVMFTWAAIIAGTLLVSLVPAFLGLIVTLPILGHTTWHLYQRGVPPAEA